MLLQPWLCRQLSSSQRLRGPILWFVPYRRVPMQRAVRFAVQEWAHLHGALPLREEGEVGFSPFNPVMPAALHSL